MGRKLRIRFKNPTVQFCGSTIQQNYGEVREKGFLFWVIENKDDFASRFVPIVNNFPFVTLDYNGNIDDLLDSAEGLPANSRFRIKVQHHTNNGELSQIKGALKSHFKPTEIVFKHEVSKEITASDAELSFAVDTLDDINTLVTEFHAGTQISEKTKEMMTTYLKEAWSSAQIDDTFSGGKFHIKRMEFDNTFGYGEGNVINFDNAEGITGIFGKNRSGKSSICGALAYGLYNGTDRGALKNLHVVNTRKNYCNVKIYFAKAGIDYMLERQTTNVTNKKGQTWAPTHLNLFEIDSVTGVKKDMSEEQRRETEKVLRDLVGNLDDFLLTSLSSQGNINKFIDLNAAARKAYLSRFLKLDIFDKLNNLLKEELNVTKRLLEAVPEKEFDSVIDELKNKLKSKGIERTDGTKHLDELKAILDDITKMLSTQSSGGFTVSEIEDQEKTVITSKNRVVQLQQELHDTEKKNAGLQENMGLLQSQIIDVDIEDLKKKKESRNDMAREIEKSELSIAQKKEEISRDKVQVKNLSDVPCGNEFPTCKYIVQAKSSKTTLETKQSQYQELTHQLALLQKSYANLLKESVDIKLAEFKDTKQKIQALTLEISQLQLVHSKLETQLHNAELNLTSANQQLDNMRANICDDSIHSEREKLVVKKKKHEIDIRNLGSDLSTLSEQIGTATAMLAQTQREKEEFEVRSLKNRALKLLSKALSKDGIPLNIVRKRLPIINAELSNILQSPTGFTLELESDEETNDMEIYLNYGDSRRIIECGSGMEKMMSSIAMRAALTNVSSLPKSDVFIVDEGFGALDGKNLESCTALLRELTKYFKSIIIISHVDGIKDAVDNIIEIDNKGIDAHVYFD